MAKITWTVLQVVTGKELQVADLIKAQSIAYACMPTRHLFERNQGKWRYIHKPIFPGYVFVETVMNAARYYAIRAVPGVIKFLGKGSGGLPQAVPEDQMEDILALKDNDPDESLIVSKDERRRRAMIRLSLLDETKYIEVAFDPYKQSQTTPA